MVFDKHLRAKNVPNNLTKRDCDEDKVSTPHYDKFIQFKILIVHIWKYFIITVTCHHHHMLLTCSI